MEDFLRLSALSVWNMNRPLSTDMIYEFSPRAVSTFLKYTKWPMSDIPTAIPRSFSTLNTLNSVFTPYVSLMRILSLSRRTYNRPRLRHSSSLTGAICPSSPFSPPSPAYREYGASSPSSWVRSPARPIPPPTYQTPPCPSSS